MAAARVGGKRGKLGGQREGTGVKGERREGGRQNQVKMGEKGEKGGKREKWGETGKEKDGKGVSLGERQDGREISVLRGKGEKKRRRV